MKALLITLGLLGISLGLVLALVALVAALSPISKKPRLQIWCAGMVMGGVVLLLGVFPKAGLMSLRFD